MAKNEPNTPDEVKTVPAQEVTAEEKNTPAPMLEIGGEAPAPEKTAEETAALPHEDGATPGKADKDRPEEPTPLTFPPPVMWWFLLTKSMRLFLGNRRR